MSSSTWKKELRLRRQPVTVPEPDPWHEFVIPEAEEHWWDREVGFSLRSGPEREPRGEPRSELRSEPRLELRPETTRAPRPEPARAPQPEPPEPKPLEPKASKPKRRAPRAERPPRPSLRRQGSDRIVGLKIGGSQLAAASISNGGQPRLERAVRTPLRGGIITGGELRDPQALSQALRDFFAENKLPRRGVRLGIASSRIGVRSFAIGGIDDERQFLNAVRFRAQEALPIPLDEAVLDYRVLDERPGEDGQPVRRVLLVVAHRDLVERYVQACRAAGLTLAGIDLEAFALLRALAPPADRSGSALVAVAIGHERTTLAVSDGRVCEFTRVLEWGGWVLNVALARVLDTTPAEVELVKRGLSLTNDAAPAGLSPEQARKAVNSVRRGIDSLARELVSSLAYYQSQPGSLGIGEVVVTGGTARLAGLAEELERLIGVPVRVGDPLGRLRVGRPVDEAEVGSLAIAIGLGIED